MVYTVHDAVRGRARFRVDGLYRTDALRSRIEAALIDHAGVRSFSVNVLTGKVLVLFNSGNSSDAIRSVIQAAVEAYRSNGNTAPAQHRQALPTAPDQREESHRFGSKPRFSRRKVRKSVIGAEDQPREPWHTMQASAALEHVGVTPDAGLSQKEVEGRLRKFGPNLLPEAVPRSGLGIFLDQFKSLPVALLSVAAGISVATGGLADALVIAGVVIINGVIGYTTETQAEKTIHSLKRLVRPSAVCVREGTLETFPAEAIVPGDILVLRSGSYVGADARLIEAHHLSIDESALTGESMPAVKEIKVLGERDIPLADRTNMVYMGTLVTGGQGLAVVVATGRYTEIGGIQTLMGEARPPETPMERQLGSMGRQLVFISGGVCGLVFLIGLLRGYGFLQMLKASLALAVAAVPEGLPMVATTTLALGIRTMKKHNVLIRHLNAVETLGSVQTICLDKTGTITLNRMTVVAMFAGMRRIKVTQGRFKSDEGDLNPYEHDELLRLIHVSCLCNESETSMEEGRYVVRGSATENALIHVAISAGVDVTALREKFRLLKVSHRSDNCNVMVTFHEVLPDRSSGNGSGIVAVKGSPQEVLSLCAWHMKHGEKLPLTEEERQLIAVENERMAGDALRVLGFAYTYCSDGTSCFDGVDICGAARESTQLVWLGLSGMMDPVRDGVSELIGKYHYAGIDTVMITGDQGPTAYAIGRELDLSGGGQIEILDSTHLGSMDPEVLKALSEKVHVFARVSPANKFQIVQALQASGKVVAMTGDGINDGPALKAADIGIAMGHTGTDVAREVADVVLEDDNLETMVIAISQGRTIYNNIRKSVHYLLATNMSEIMVMLAGMASGMGQPLNTMQLLWINLLSDIAPGLALALEAPEPDVLGRPPRSPHEPIIRSADFRRIAFESAALSAGAMGAYGYGIARYGVGPRAGTMAFMGLTFGQILHAVSCRSEKYSMFDKETLPPNRYLDAALAGTAALQGLAMIVPALRSLLGISPIGLTDWMVVGGAAVAPLLINEATKRSPVSSRSSSVEESVAKDVLSAQPAAEMTT